MFLKHDSHNWNERSKSWHHAQVHRRQVGRDLSTSSSSTSCSKQGQLWGLDPDWSWALLRNQTAQWPVWLTLLLGYPCGDKISPLYPDWTSHFNFCTLVLIFPPLQRAWLHLLSDLRATGRLLLFSWVNKPCSSSLSSWGSTVPQPQSPWGPPLNSVYWRPKLDSVVHQWKMQILQGCFFFLHSPFRGIPG